VVIGQLTLEVMKKITFKDKGNQIIIFLSEAKECFFKTENQCFLFFLQRIRYNDVEVFQETINFIFIFSLHTVKRPKFGNGT